MGYTYGRRKIALFFIPILMKRVEHGLELGLCASKWLKFCRYCLHHPLPLLFWYQVAKTECSFHEAIILAKICLTKFLFCLYSLLVLRLTVITRCRLMHMTLSTGSALQLSGGLWGLLTKCPNKSSQLCLSIHTPVAFIAEMLLQDLSAAACYQTYQTQSLNAAINFPWQLFLLL